MGIIWELAVSLKNPIVWMTGLGVGVLLLSQETKWRWRIVGVLILWDLVILASKFEIETKHGLYRYQEAWTSSNAPQVSPLINPGSMQPEQVHLAGVQLAGAILVTAIFVAVWGLLRARSTPQPGE